MQLTPENLSSLTDCAIAAAKQAGQLIESYAKKSVVVEHKSGGDSPASQVVTEVDLLCDAMIVKALAATCEQFDLAILTEESEDDKARLEKQAFWCVDPMDGTLSFIEAIHGYSVSIALVSKSGEPLIGVIFDPMTQTLYTATKGQGTFRNGKPWAIAASDKPLTLVCDRDFIVKSYYGVLYQALEVIAMEHGFSGLEVLEKNGAALNAVWVLENAPAFYLKCPKPEQGGGSVWDFAASASMFLEMGAAVSDAHGQPLDLNRADSTFMNHRGVLFCTDFVLAKDIHRLVELCKN